MPGLKLGYGPHAHIRIIRAAEHYHLRRKTMEYKNDLPHPDISVLTKKEVTTNTLTCVDLTPEDLRALLRYAGIDVPETRHIPVRVSARYRKGGGKDAYVDEHELEDRDTIRVYWNTTSSELDVT